MNTVGKILVVLNFLFALAVGALLVMVVALHNQWKERYVALEKEARALYEVDKTTVLSSNSVANDNRKFQLDLERERATFKDKEDLWKSKENFYRDEISERDNKLVGMQQTIAQAKQLTKRQADEIALLNTIIKDRETSIVRLEADVKTFRGQAQNFESIARTKQSQNEGLLDQIRDLGRALAAKEAGVNPDRMVLLNPNEPNPPAVKIEGKIQKVDGILVEISLGTDHGLKENNTLDVFRLQPEVKWLGTIRIVDARHHTSVGRLIPSSTTAFRTQLREGDLVSSKLK